MTTHVEALSRADRLTGVVNGNQLTASSPASMVINAAAGRIRIAGLPVDVEADTVELDAAHETLPRVDVIYRDAAGDLVAAKGTPAAIVDPKVLADWHSYTSPQPPASIPAGAILGAVFIAAGATTISTGYIWMFAGGVGEISTSIASPGSDAYPASEAAINTGLAAKISHSLATAANDFIIASGNGVFVKKTLAEVKTILGLGSAAYTALSDYAVAAKGVTNGDTHDHQSGRGAAIAAAATVFSATAKILARKTAGGGAGEECSLTEILDLIGSVARGDILYRGASGWSRLGKGTSGYVLTQGADDPAWASDPIVATLTTRGDLLYRGASAPTRLAKGTAGQGLVQGANDPAWTTRSFDAAFPFGDGSAVLVAGACAIRIPIASKIVAARIRSLDAAGAPLSGSITCSLHIHDIDAAIGAASDTFAIASDTDMSETGLNIAVAAGKWLTVVTSDIASCKQVVCILSLEAT
jgi:hypothetical protein